MAKNQTLHILVNDFVKTNAEKTLDMLGLSISEAVNMLLHQISLVGGLPFDVKIPEVSKTTFETFAPENITIKNKEDLYQKLDVGIKQIKQGKVIDSDVVIEQIGDKFGF